MNILFFTYDFPYPTNSGGKTRAYNLMKFGKKDNNITLFSFTRDSYHEKHKKALNEIGIEDIYLFPRRSVVDPRNIVSLISSKSLFHSLYFDEDICNRLLEIVKKHEIDLVHFESFYTGFYMSQMLRDLGVKQVFGTENIEYKVYEGLGFRSVSFLKKSFFLNQAKKVRKEEENFYKEADRILAVTENEATYIKNKSAKPCDVIENGVDVSALDKIVRRKSGDPRTLLFIGNFSYFPNVDAMEYFMRNVFPILPEDIKVVVVGKGGKELHFLQHERIKTLSFVENAGDMYAMGDVFISPMRIGGGTNFKILEAMAAGIPVVALRDRVEDLGFTDRKDLLIVDTPEQFANSVMLLLDDKSLHKRLVAQAKSNVSENYNWKTIGNKLDAVWRKTVHEKT